MDKVDYENNEIYNFCKIIDPISVISASIGVLELKYSSEINEDVQMRLDKIQRAINEIIEHVNVHQTPNK